MATLAECWTTSQTAAFQQRVLMAVLQTARQYTSEEAGTIPIDRKRRALAVSVMNNPTPYMIPFSYLLAAAQVLTSDPDTTVQQMVYNVWDNVAGILTEDYGGL
jgi:hypothetical protein